MYSCVRFVSSFDSQKNIASIWANCYGKAPKKPAIAIHLTSQLFTLDSLPNGGEVPLLLLFVYSGILIIWDGGHNLRPSHCTSPLNTAVHMGTSASSWAKNTAACALGHDRKCGVTECIG